MFASLFPGTFGAEDFDKLIFRFKIEYIRKELVKIHDENDRKRFIASLLFECLYGPGADLQPPPAADVADANADVVPDE